MQFFWFARLCCFLSLKAHVPAHEKLREEGLTELSPWSALMPNSGPSSTLIVADRPVDEADISRTFVQDPKALKAFQNRAGFAYMDFLCRKKRQPDGDELSLIISGGLNHFSRRLYEWRTGRDAVTGMPACWPPRRELARVLLPVFRHYRRRETALRRRFFSTREISLIYFVPPVPPRSSVR